VTSHAQFVDYLAAKHPAVIIILININSMMMMLINTFLLVMKPMHIHQSQPPSASRARKDSEAVLGVWRPAPLPT